MKYECLTDYFPQLLESETRSFTNMNPDSLIPLGEYGLLELFCSTPGCDCRRVMFQVVSSNLMRPVAVINFGWETRDFYCDWFGKYEKEIIDDLKGPCLNQLSPQSEYADAVLEIIIDMLKDRLYVKRIKQHYNLFKKFVDKRQLEKDYENTEVKKYSASRNDPCPCGSGKKYKKCCLIN